MATILVVDDSEVDRRVTRGILGQHAGFTVETAEHGRAALEKMQEMTFDVVVTDLQMPEMDGLQLVREIRVHFPVVPVILVTAHGSEQLAMEALEQGAASYCPKSAMAERLSETIEDLLSLTHANRSYEQLISCMGRTEFDFTLHNDAGLFDPLVDLVQQMASGMGLCDPTGQFRMGVALKEALLNAMYRGNLEITAEQMEEARESLMMGSGLDRVEQRRQQSPYKDRRIYVNVRLTPTEARFQVRDEGPGFNVAAAAVGELKSFDAKKGRGLVLMKAFMDEVHFNDRGNEVILLKKKEDGP